MPGWEWFSDTDPRALEVFLRIQREIPPQDKIAGVFRMSEMLVRLAEDNVRRLCPEAGEREVFLRAAAQRLDRQTMIRVYGWDPEKEDG